MRRGEKGRAESLGAPHAVKGWGETCRDLETRSQNGLKSQDAIRKGARRASLPSTDQQAITSAAMQAFLAKAEEQGWSLLPEVGARLNSRALQSRPGPPAPARRGGPAPRKAAGAAGQPSTHGRRKRNLPFRRRRRRCWRRRRAGRPACCVRC